MGADPTRRDTPERMLRLLSLLQSRRVWSGNELAERLGVTERTVRRDVDRLRALDYPVVGLTGATGGYRLTPGTNLPPLLLTDDEAVAVIVGLVGATGDTLSGIEESSVRALAKIEQMLPNRLRSRLSALTAATTAVPRKHDTPPVDPAVLATLAACSRDRENVSFDYRDRRGQETTRRVEPHSLVTVHALWYLLGYDPSRDDWRTFRVDRIRAPVRTHHRNPPRELPAPDAASYLTRSFANASYLYTARMTVGLSADAVRAGVFGPIPGEVDDHGPECSTVRLSADSPELVTQYVAVIAALGAEFTIDAPSEVTRRLHHLGRRLTR
ncbi:helix-turn-helix transcriptional regulator [Haloactinospora alba]|nr:WYL domain-containing protein [Haloactinospora alba]